MLQPSTCLCGLTWMILLKVSWLLPNLEVYGERVDLASLSIVLVRVFIEMATISKVVFLVHLWGANYQPFDNCHDGLTVSGTRLRRIRDVDMKRDYAFVVCISLLFYQNYFSS